MTAVSNQGMDVFIEYTKVFTFWVWTRQSRVDEGSIKSPRGKISLGGYSLDWTATTFPQTPGRERFWLWRSQFFFFFYTKRAITLTFGL
jgi:hypothetical protein